MFADIYDFVEDQMIFHYQICGNQEIANSTIIFSFQRFCITSAEHIPSTATANSPF